MRGSKHAWLLTLTLAIACTTAKDDLEIQGNGNELSMAEVASSEGVDREVVQEPNDAPKAAIRNKQPKSPVKRAKRPGTRQAKLCLDLLKTFMMPYRELHQKLPRDAAVPQSSVARLVRMRPESCQGPERNATLQTLNHAVSDHGVRIGVLLPLSTQKSPLVTHVMSGIKAAMEEAGLSYDKQVILVDSGGDATRTEAQIAQLVFRDRVTMLVGGLEDTVAKTMVRWADRLAIPTVILSRDRKVVEGSRHAFRVYPDEKRLAITLALAAKEKDYKRIAILRPSSHKSDGLIDYFEAAVVGTGGHVTHDVIYTPGHYGSMEAAARQLFKIDLVARRDEYRKAYERAKTRAREAGMPFDPRLVTLPPIVEFDAIFIPDDFLTVRHFTKLFKYHGVSKIPLIGNHEWRSPALVKPYDETLEGAFFADFIGSYSKLPRSISAPTLGSPYFVRVEDVVPVDFRLIGYRVGKIASLALRNPNVRRNAIARALVRMQSDSALLFGDDTLFDRDRNVNWPTYVFTVKGESLTMEPGKMDPKLALASRRSAQDDLGGKRPVMRRGPRPVRVETPYRRRLRQTAFAWPSP